MQSIEYNRRNNPILNHIGFKGNEEADKAAKQAIDMAGMTTTRLSNTD